MRKIKADLGQLFVIGFEGKDLDPEVRNLIRDVGPAGVILFQRNLESPEQILDLTRALQDASPHRPLLVSIDQEGGRVWRLPPPFTFFPEARTLGTAGLDSLAWSAAKVIAGELAAVGIHCNFSPVLDLNTNPDNPVIGDRALGTEPENVACLARSILLSFRENGIAGCGKHFPGHGDTDLDSHLALPTLSHHWSRLFEVEMAPYKILLQDPRKPLELIMTGHLLVPELDPKRPATLSRRILKGILRRHFGFQGLIITDDLEMGAITGTYPVPESSRLAFQAGADLLLICHTPTLLPDCIEALHRALQKGEISSGRVAMSLRRISDFRKRLLGRLPSESSRKRLFYRIGSTEHVRIAQRVGSYQEPALQDESRT